MAVRFNRMVALVILVILCSCDGFTEVDIPQSQLTGAAVYQDIATARAALADIYARMRDAGVASGTALSGTTLMANYSDDMDFYGSSAPLEQFNKHTLLPSNSNLLRLWNVVYGEIYAINALIEGVNASPVISGEDKNRLLGEAKFLRAFNYFYLVNLFGDIPYVTSTDYDFNADISKSSSEIVWQNIINELLDAETFLPESYPTDDRVRANKAAAKALLARAYLYTNDYMQADAYATSLINDGTYAIESDLAVAFLKDAQSIIWAFHPGVAGQNTRDASAYSFSSGPPTKSSLSADLYDAFEPGDARKTLWIRLVTNSAGTWYRPFKYKLATTTGQSQEYTIVLRLEEQILIRAEARAMTGNLSGAQQDLNVTRNRAGLPPTSAATQEQLLEAILQERRFELFTEQSHRWFDLKRTGYAANVLSVIKPGWRDTDLLLPIPESELLLNENLLPQNPGY